MKKPTTALIGAHEWDLVYDTKLGSMGAMGATSIENLTILLDPAVASSVLKETLIHEMFHGVWKQTPLTTLYPDEDSDSPGEAIIRTLAPYVYHFIRNNREVVRWLQSS